MIVRRVVIVIAVKKVRDIETEEMLEDLHGKIREREKENAQLKEKVCIMIEVREGQAFEMMSNW